MVYYLVGGKAKFAKEKEAFAYANAVHKKTGVFLGVEKKKGVMVKRARVGNVDLTRYSMPKDLILALQKLGIFAKMRELTDAVARRQQWVQVTGDAWESQDYWIQVFSPSNFDDNYTVVMGHRTNSKDVFRKKFKNKDDAFACAKHITHIL